MTHWSEHARRVLDLAGEGADRFGHRYRRPEQAFGVQALGEATWRVTRRVTRRPAWRGGRVVWTPLYGPPLVAKRALHLASQQASTLGHRAVSPDICCWVCWPTLASRQAR